MTRRERSQSGQVLVLVAVVLLALIGSAALVLLAGSFEWQRNQVQQLADQAALDSALKIGIGCNAASANTVITEADTFLATQRTRTGTLSVAAGTCATPYTGTDTFAGGLSATIHYPYRAHQQQVEVILTVSLPISFGTTMGATNTTVTARAVGQQLSGSAPAVMATTLDCTGGQFNVGGTIATQNAIALSGSCAVYAHTRFDPTSGTYSDLGNASVYAGGQTWVGGLGVCAAGLNSGSSNAICADGYELSGHVTMTCGTSGTSAFLSAGDATINPNPCAAGTAPQPVPPTSILLPPEPNTDGVITATLPGGVPCSPSGVYSNIQVNGVVVGTGNAAAPTQDAGGYVHFKKGCYGYLNVGNLGTSAVPISNRQTGPEVGPINKNITPTLPAPSLAGTLLVVDIKSETHPPDKPFTAPAGWLFANGGTQDGAAHADIWYYPNNPGGITGATFGISPASIDAVAQMTEWNNVATASPLDVSGTQQVGSSQLSVTNSTSGATSTANELVITIEGFAPQVGQAIVPGVGWNSLTNDPTNGFAGEYRLDLPAGVASETVTSTVPTTWSVAIAAFKPAAGGSAPNGAVLDPGFYYFNGSGFAGGGGICLNGGVLLARDVTLEFVNQAGFSSGTCAVGGGTACTGSCQFGSTPCSISACPPNAPADLASGGYSWFAAPCSQAPTGDASCPGSSWCPVGDRACWNLLIWAASSNTGQITIAGTAAKGWWLGSVFWPATCTYTANGTTTLDGSLECGTLTVSAAAGAGVAVGSDYGINTALVEAVLVE
jgi:hypothetical protein